MHNIEKKVYLNQLEGIVGNNSEQLKNIRDFFDEYTNESIEINKDFIFEKYQWFANIYAQNLKIAEIITAILEDEE